MINIYLLGTLLCFKNSHNQMFYHESINASRPSVDNTSISATTIVKVRWLNSLYWGKKWKVNLTMRNSCWFGIANLFFIE